MPGQDARQDWQVQGARSVIRDTLTPGDRELHLSSNLGLPGAYVPEGLLTSCSWDYVTFTRSVRSYTMLLFCFVFFLPLLVIIYCYIFIFRAIRETGR